MATGRRTDLEAKVNNLVQRVFDNYPEAYIRKYPDMPRGFRKVGGKEIPMFQQKKPFDYFGCSRGKSIAIENKGCKTTFRFKDLKDHQRDALTVHQASGGLSYICIYFEREDSFCVIEFIQFLILEDEYDDQKRATISFDEIKEYSCWNDELPGAQIPQEIWE